MMKRDQNTMDNSKNAEYLKYNLMLLRMAALLKLKQSGNFSRILLQVWRLLLLFIVWLTFVAVFIDMIHKWVQNFEGSVMNYMFVGSTFYLGWKTIYYYYYDDQSENFINGMNKVIKYQSRTGFEEKNMSRTIQIAKWMSIGWFWTGLIASHSLIIMHFILGGYSKRTLSIPAWYPYIYTVSPYYELTVLLQIINQTIMLVLVSSTDAFYASTSLMMAKQFEILSWEIKNYFYTNLLQWGIPKEKVIEFRDGLNGAFNQKDENVAIYDVIAEPKFNDDLLRNFNDLIKFHKALISLFMDMENFFSPLILLYFVPIVVVIIPFTYSMITTRNLVVLAQGIFAKIWLFCEVLFVTYFAELISQKSEDVQTSLYEMPWYFCDRRYISTFKIIHQRTHTPVTLTVGKFKGLSLNMFVWTVKTVYSFTTVLRNMNQRT